MLFDSNMDGLDFDGVMSMRVSRDRYRDAVKFLMGLGTGPNLSKGDQHQLRYQMLNRMPHGVALDESAAMQVLTYLGWQKEL